MFYYQHHVGDHKREASHLSLLEEGAFLRLRDRYASTEQPLPQDLAAVQRLVTARTDEERQAVNCVLEEYFELTAEGWIYQPLREQIEHFKAKSAVGRHAANVRWEGARRQRSDTSAMHAHSAGSANQEPTSNYPTADNQKYSLSQPSAEFVCGSLEAEFRRFWEAAPRKKSDQYGKAFEAYKKVVKRLGRGICPLLLSKMERYAKNYEGHDPKYVKLPHTWLADGRWEDEDL